MRKLKRPRLTDDEREQIAEAYRKRMLTKQISAMFQRGNTTIYGVIKQMGIPLRTNGRGREGPRA